MGRPRSRHPLLRPDARRSRPHRRRHGHVPQRHTREILGAFCLTEAQAGSDAAAIETRATRHDAVYKLQGTKTWVTNGNVAGVFIVFAKTDPPAGGKGITAFLIEPNFPGFKSGRHEEKMGQRCSPSVEIVLNDCEVP